MSIVTPRSTWTDDDGTGTTGTIINNAELAKIYDNIDAAFALAQNNYCVAYHNTTQSVNSGTSTALNLNSEDSDANGMHDTVTNNTRVTVGVTGSYKAHGRALFATNATGQRIIFIRKNGTTEMAKVIVAKNDGTNATAIEVHMATEALTAGDYLELIAFQDSGAAINVGNATRSASTELFVEQAE
jgi:hypothetical protein